MSTDSPSYTRVAIALHWIIALLIIGNLIGGKIMHGMETSTLKFEFYQLHKSFGILILVFSVLRLIWRLTHNAPPLPDTMAGWERTAAKASHHMFYALMIGVPVAGWMMASASPVNIPTKIFKTVPWPDFPGLTRSEELADSLAKTHELLAYAIAALLVLHVGAALRHHFVKKDDVLTRMIPMLKAKQ